MLRIIQPIYSTTEHPWHQPYTTRIHELPKIALSNMKYRQKKKKKKNYRFYTEPATNITRVLVRLIIWGDVIHVGATGSFIWFAVFRLRYKSTLLPNEWQVNDTIYQHITIFTFLREFIITWRMLTLVLRSRIFLPWRWRRYDSPKRRFNRPHLHGATSQKTAFFIVTAVKTSNPTYHHYMFRCVSVISKGN
jgi:hypothetical protein